MNFIFPLISLILSKVFSGSTVGDFFKKQVEIKTAELDVQRQVVIEQYKLASETARAQLELSQTVLQATGRRFKYFTFVMWFGPFMVGCVNATWANFVFNNLAQMPQWYVQSCVTIMFTIWGIQVAAPVVSSIFSNLTDYLGDRRQDKIEMKKVSADSYKKAYYDAMRAVKGNVTPQDVALGDKILDTLAGKGTYSQ